MTRVNISSQTVQVFGFMRLGRMPKIRSGSEAGPRSGTGTRICCQQPLQIMDRDCDNRLRPSVQQASALQAAQTTLHSNTSAQNRYEKMALIPFLGSLTGQPARPPPGGR